MTDSWVLVFCCDCGELLGVRDHIRIRAEHFEQEGHRGQRYVRTAVVAEGAAALIDHDEDSWRDYDHGFRDGYQAALREGPDALLQAARWVVQNWDREATQHASMAALREAVQRSKETP